MKLDIGSGPNKREGYLGIDQYGFDGKVDLVLDVTKERLPFDDGAVEAVHMSHTLEHFTAEQRCFVLNEIHRVLQPGGEVTIICPIWSSSRAYCDPTHQWPPIGEFFWFYLDKTWRMANAPHTDKSIWPKGYDCDFTATWGYAMHGSLLTRNTEYQQFALNNYKEAAQDIHATLKKK